jgi:hypothetical protein
MSPIRRVASASVSAVGTDVCEVYFVKGGHVYSFRYEEGREKALIAALLDSALDPQLNLDLEDARKLLRALGLVSPITPAL